MLATTIIIVIILMLNDSFQSDQFKKYECIISEENIQKVYKLMKKCSNSLKLKYMQIKHW